LSGTVSISQGDGSVVRHGRPALLFRQGDGSVVRHGQPALLSARGTVLLSGMVGPLSL